MKLYKLKKQQLKNLYFYLSIIFVFSIAGFWIKNVTIETKTNKNKVKTGEIFIYEVTIEGYLTPSAVLILPEFNNFKIVSQNQIQRYSSEQNKEKLSFNITYYLFAEKPGAYTIEKVILEDNGKELKGNPITIEVKGQLLKEKKKILPYIEKGIDL